MELLWFKCLDGRYALLCLADALFRCRIKAICDAHDRRITR